MHYTPGKLEYFCLIRGGLGADYHQNPEFHQLPEGELLLYWSAYDFDECSNNSIVLYSTSPDRGITWSDTQVYLADYPSGISTAKILTLRGASHALMLNTRTQHDEIGDRP